MSSSTIKNTSHTATTEEQEEKKTNEGVHEKDEVTTKLEHPSSMDEPRTDSLHLNHATSTTLKASEGLVSSTNYNNSCLSSFVFFSDSDATYNKKTFSTITDKPGHENGNEENNTNKERHSTHIKKTFSTTTTTDKPGHENGNEENKSTKEMESEKNTTEELHEVLQ